MDLTSQQTLDRKREEIRVLREQSVSKRREADQRRSEASRKQREEEEMDRKAEKAQKHSEELKRYRELSVEKIERYQRKIDHQTIEMRESERQIDDCRVRLRNQQERIRASRQTAINCRLDADLLRTEADVACMTGVKKRETQGMNAHSNHAELLLKAEEKQREAMRMDREAEESDRRAIEGEHNVHRLCNQLLVQGMVRGTLEREKEEEEKKVAELAEKLRTYKIEAANCEYLSLKRRGEEARLDQEWYQLTAEAEEAEQAALQAEQEANRIEKEISHYNH